METKLTKDAVEALSKEQRELKLDSVHAAMSAAKQLYIFGVKGYEDIISCPEKWFDYYYDMNFEQLHQELENMSAMATRRIYELHPDLNECNTPPTIYRVLNEDEMDTED